jgi:hypothetical protein
MDRQAPRRAQKGVHSPSFCLGRTRVARRALGRPKEQLAPPKRRNLLPRGSVSIIRSALVRGVREAQWDWGGHEAAETPQNLAKPMRNPSETPAKT